MLESCVDTSAPEDSERYSRNARACDALLELLELHHGNHAPVASVAIEATPPVPVSAPGLHDECCANAASELPEWHGPQNTIHPNAITVAGIQHAVCAAFDMKKIQLLSRRRQKDIVRPRQISMWFCREHTKHSFPAIAKFHGLTDHSTALHACRVIDRALDAGGDLAKKVEEVADLLGVETEGRTQ